MGSQEIGLPGLDRREYFRARYYADVEIERGSATLHARTSDISLGGMRLEMEDPLWVGAEFQARLGLPEGESLAVACVVRQVIPELGMGVEFLDLTPSAQARLRKLIESLPH